MTMNPMCWKLIVIVWLQGKAKSIVAHSTNPPRVHHSPKILRLSPLNYLHFTADNKYFSLFRGHLVPSTLVHSSSPTLIMVSLKKNIHSSHSASHKTLKYFVKYRKKPFTITWVHCNSLHWRKAFYQSIKCLFKHSTHHW